MERVGPLEKVDWGVLVAGKQRDSLVKCRDMYPDGLLVRVGLAFAWICDAKAGEMLTMFKIDSDGMVDIRAFGGPA